MGSHPVITQEEFAGRLRRTREELARRGVAAGIFDECESMAWLTGYGNSENRWRCVVVPVEGDPFVLIRALDAAPC
ncbi:aminopeptidase P family N-terminal domain-containing protein, partial [Klebsiella pneumoniae]